VPVDAAYFFQGDDVGLQWSNEIQTNNWGDAPGFNIKYEDTTGNLVIRHTAPGVDSTCTLPTVPFGG
jgi:hypothetical protein